MVHVVSQVNTHSRVKLNRYDCGRHGEECRQHLADCIVKDNTKESCLKHFIVHQVDVGMRDILKMN